MGCPVLFSAFAGWSGLGQWDFAGRIRVGATRHMPSLYANDVRGNQSASDYFPRPGSRQPSSVVQVFGWEEKKSKTWWGGNTGRPRQVGGSSHSRNDSGQSQPFMMTSALVPDLYCPGCSSAETLSKEASLMRTAARYRYKVNVSKISATVTTELSWKGKGRAENSETSRKKRSSR